MPGGTELRMLRGMSEPQTDLSRIVRFLEGAEALKDVIRSAWTSGGRRESAAEHSWRLALLALLLEDALPGVDLERLLALCIVHDLGEALRGDVPAVEQTAPKAAQERADLEQLAAPLPARLQARLLALWDEYEAARTPEARLAKGLDKIETILQHTQGANPPDFDYAFNLRYGEAFTRGHPVLEELRALVDARTRERQAGG